MTDEIEKIKHKCKKCAEDSKRYAEECQCKGGKA